MFNFVFLIISHVLNIFHESKIQNKIRVLVQPVGESETNSNKSFHFWVVLHSDSRATCFWLDAYCQYFYDDWFAGEYEYFFNCLCNRNPIHNIINRETRKISFLLFLRFYKRINNCNALLHLQKAPKLSRNRIEIFYIKQYIYCKYCNLKHIRNLECFSLCISIVI